MWADQRWSAAVAFVVDSKFGWLLIGPTNKTKLKNNSPAVVAMPVNSSSAQWGSEQVNSTSALTSRVRFLEEVVKKTPPITKGNDKEEPPLKKSSSSKAEKSTAKLGFDLE